MFFFPNDLAMGRFSLQRDKTAKYHPGDKGKAKKEGR
jgi:hypothetical protein